MLKIKGIFNSKEIFLDGKPLSPRPSLEIVNHSPDGFNWGYGGSGPAQLALAILLSAKERKKALEQYREFTSKVIARLPQDDFEVCIDEETFEFL